ncbi:ankyrin repeat domain-containing protein [Ningiella sp. W23]|uniref:ankyrin repeat domain-containing protein n=1 Tax=Ningiella sp. W23 TaxID=3023715 RepID=UPI0037573978
MTIPQQIIQAIKNKDVKLLKELLSKNPDITHVVTPLGSWLHIATRHNAKESVEFLLEQGIDVNIEGGVSNSGPINAAASEGYTELVKFYLEKGAILDTSEPEKNPLFSAIHNGHVDVVKMLLDANIDTSIKYSGSTMENMDALAFAKEWGRTDIVNMLIEHNKSKGLQL